MTPPATPTDHDNHLWKRVKAEANGDLTIVTRDQTFFLSFREGGWFFRSEKKRGLLARIFG
jgi:hypothetical protein